MPLNPNTINQDSDQTAPVGGNSVDSDQTAPVGANSVDPDQTASVGANMKKKKCQVSTGK